MKLATLQKLHCPYCASGFEVAKAIDVSKEVITTGIVRCDCSDYPIVAGILVLKVMDVLSLGNTLSALYKSDIEGAVSSLLSTGQSFWKRLAYGLKRRNIIFSDIVLKIQIDRERRRANKLMKASSFAEAIDAMGIKTNYANYLKYRFSGSSFIASIPLIMMMNDFDGDILDIGCGTGQVAFVISQRYPGRKLTLTDFSFGNLYLAKNFFVPNAEYVCLDANDPLPFPDKNFAAIFSMDAIHHVYSKYQLMREVSRVNCLNGILILPHLHNREGQDPVKAFALTAEAWIKLLPFPHKKLFAEEDILRDFLANDRLDLRSGFSAKDSRNVNAFSIVAGTKHEIFKVYDNVGKPFIETRNHIAINPIYRISISGDVVTLKKEYPSVYFKSENSILEEFIPETVILDKKLFQEIIDRKITDLNTDKIMELMRNFTLINTPKDDY